MSDENKENIEEKLSSGDEANDSNSTEVKGEKCFPMRQLRTLDYFISNGFKQVFHILDIQNKGCLAKTQLQVICANICEVFSLTYISEDLAGYLNNQNELTVHDFIEYVDRELLPKVSCDKIDLENIERIAWTIVEKERKKNDTNILSDKEVFKLWLAFNKINIDGTITIDIAEASLLLQEFMKAIGTPWTKGPLDDFSEKLQLTFWELINCLETRYINNTPKSVYLEGLESISNVYVDEIIKSGNLTKKGHRIKSLKERWFILKPYTITYHENKTHLNKKKGFIAINKSSKVESIPDSKNTKCRFAVTCGNTGTEYEMEAVNQKTKNEWITDIQQCIDTCEGPTPLMRILKNRSHKRKQRRDKQAEEGRQRLEQEELIRRQLEELNLIRQARDEAQAQAENEAALLEEERKRREELEALKAEYEKLLEDERKAREAESLVRLRQQEILKEEMAKRQELEKIKLEQDRILEEERKAREGLEEMSKDQAKALEEERERLKTLDEARKAAEAEVQEAHIKLEAAEEERQAAAAKVEAAKQRTRTMRMPIGLARPLELQQQGIITHRGAGAFTDQDFSKTPLYLSNERPPTAVNKRQLPGDERAQIVETNLVKPSMGKAIFEGVEKEEDKSEQV